MFDCGCSTPPGLLVLLAPVLQPLLETLDVSILVGNALDIDIFTDIISICIYALISVICICILFINTDLMLTCRGFFCMCFIMYSHL